MASAGDKVKSAVTDREAALLVEDNMEAAASATWAAEAAHKTPFFLFVTFLVPLGFQARSFLL